MRNNNGKKFFSPADLPLRISKMAPILSSEKKFLFIENCSTGRKKQVWFEGSLSHRFPELCILYSYMYVEYKYCGAWRLVGM